MQAWHQHETEMNSLDIKETILVIDDSKANLDYLNITLSDAGYNVLIAMDGTNGIEQAYNEQIDLILLDIIIPKIDGFETCRILKSNSMTKDIPIIFMTALSETGQKVKGLNLGAVDYITKPFQEEEILARIQVHLKLRRLNLELDQQKQQLEHRVKSRTAELSEALEELKKAQLQLVQSEKISSLGQLVAGVAHEVNNPLGFIFSNLHYADQYVDDLVHLIKLYQKQFPNPGNEIEEEIEAIDLNHILEDLPKVISSMKLGTDRIQGIMQSLRNFSRADGDQKIAVDIHDGLETTLMILQHRLKARPKRPMIEVIKEYENLPPVKCYSGQLNQVFMNLLTNAIDALEEGMGNGSWGIESTPNSHCPKIRITTELVEDTRVLIRISDNGPGMPEPVQNQIFNPFFTTKAEGKGTGLGLSISHQIIAQKHNGMLQCISSFGQGTEFIIEIPLDTNQLPVTSDQ
ncbi:hybrid sensor histidine kinase/response regulator [Scytonema hofmannii PCC 7110]|uniref:histidine kinase n=2 Tax=Scytonema hofmannii TaxID=34078 RepID=A0A139XH57_9CYAN|nr:response regulator [Scytonema hofmannii]KYC44026.1 hybrid sensor histidine kinase/response regulator [Scytonema hofmannii PCC 7110]